jgi:pimeloyl-ACP methyl ester carboxylesterase
MKHKTTQVGEVTLHVVEAGTGPAVVLLHGFPESWFSWRKQIPALADVGYRVIAPDLRGYNESSKPHGVEAYKLTEVVRDVAGLIDEPCAVVGHDWGGAVAWLLAMTRPELVSKLVILNSPHPVPLSRELRHSREQRLRMAYQLLFQPPWLPELFLRLFLPTILRRLGHFTADEVRVYAEGWRQPGALTGMTNYYRALRRYRRELRPLVRPIDVPTLMIWGERDPVFTRASTENFSEYVPHLRMERIATAGHFVQTDAAERVNELLIDFLGR